MYIYFEYQYLEALCGIISNILDVCKSTPAENSLSHTHTNSLSFSLSPSLQSQHVTTCCTCILHNLKSEAELSTKLAMCPQVMIVGRASGRTVLNGLLASETKI